MGGHHRGRKPRIGGIRRQAGGEALLVCGSGGGGEAHSGKTHLKLADEEEGHESHRSMFTKGVEVDL